MTATVNQNIPVGYKQTEIGVIPKDWDVKKLSGIAPLQRGFDLPASQLRNGTYPVVYSNGILNFHNKAMAKAPGVVTGRSGTIGKVNYIEKDYWPHNTTLWVTNFKGNDERYVYYLYSYLNIERFSTGSGVPTLNRNDVHDFQVGIPKSKIDQTAIATALSDADTLIEKVEKLIEKKKNIKQGAMQELLTGKKRLTGFSGKWDVRLLPEISWFQEGPGVRTSQFTSTGIKLLNGTNIYKGKLLLDNTNRFISEKEAFGPYSHFLVDDGDILIASSGITIDKFEEKISFAKKDNLPLCMNTSTIRFKIKGKNLEALFLYYFLMSKKFKDQIGAQATGSAQLNFGPSHLEKVEIYLPQEKAEQTAIASILSGMDSEIEKLESQLTKYKNLKQGMMQKLLTGKIRLLKK